MEMKNVEKVGKVAEKTGIGTIRKVATEGIMRENAQFKRSVWQEIKWIKRYSPKDWKLAVKCLQKYAEVPRAAVQIASWLSSIEAAYSNASDQIIFAPNYYTVDFPISLEKAAERLSEESNVKKVLDLKATPEKAEEAAHELGKAVAHSVQVTHNGCAYMDEDGRRRYEENVRKGRIPLEGGLGYEHNKTLLSSEELKERLKNEPVE